MIWLITNFVAIKVVKTMNNFTVHFVMLAFQSNTPRTKPRPWYLRPRPPFIGLKTRPRTNITGGCFVVSWHPHSETALNKCHNTYRYMLTAGLPQKNCICWLLQSVSFECRACSSPPSNYHCKSTVKAVDMWRCVMTIMWWIGFVL